MTEQDTGPHQTEPSSPTPQHRTNEEIVLRVGERLIGETTYQTEHVMNADGTLKKIRHLPEPRIEQRFGPGDVILS